MSSCDVVIATRNRLAALEVTLPMWAAEVAGRGRLIVVDASEDHDAVAELGARISERCGVECFVCQCGVGSSVQRNVGLRHVDKPVVFFPDDDSVPWPDTIARMMRVYERDGERTIGAVCAVESARPPAVGELGLDSARYEMAPMDRIRQRVTRARATFERRWIPDPFLLHGRECMRRSKLPSWATEEDVVLVEWMTGFRMSFRTEVIRRIGFNETLSEYGLNEDIDASFGVWRTHIVVGAKRARIHHRRFPGPRGDAMRMGAVSLLNRAYVVSRHADEGAPARTQLVPYSRYKVAQYAAAGATSTYGRQWLRGAMRALWYVPTLVRANAEELDTAYSDALAACLGRS